MHKHLPFTTAGNKLMFGYQTRASRGTIVSICCTVGPAYHRGTFSKPSTHDVLALKKHFQSILEFWMRDTKLYKKYHSCIPIDFIGMF
jgi:hypothetical protein